MRPTRPTRMTRRGRLLAGAVLTTIPAAIPAGQALAASAAPTPGALTGQRPSDCVQPPRRRHRLAELCRRRASAAAAVRAPGRGGLAGAWPYDRRPPTGATAWPRRLRRSGDIRVVDTHRCRRAAAGRSGPRGRGAAPGPARRRRRRDAGAPARPRRPQRPARRRQRPAAARAGRSRGHPAEPLWPQLAHGGHARVPGATAGSRCVPRRPAARMACACASPATAATRHARPPAGSATGFEQAVASWYYDGGSDRDAGFTPLTAWPTRACHAVLT